MIDAALLEEAKCYLCLGVSLTEALKMALLARIAAGGGGGAAQSPWTSDIDGACFNLNNVCKYNGIGVYRALISQSGTDAPVATVLENTLGGTLVWSYNAGGDYFATLAGAFPETKTWFSTKPNSEENEVLVTLRRDNDDSMNLVVEGGADGELIFHPVEILVYPATPQCPDCA